MDRCCTKTGAIRGRCRGKSCAPGNSRWKPPKGDSTMAVQRVISADSHMTEPGDLWVERLDRKYRDNAPRVIKNEKSGNAPYQFVGPGIHPLTVAGVFAAGRSGNELREHMKHGYEAARPSG